MKGRKFLLRYRLEVGSLSHFDEALWELSLHEGHREFLLPEEGSRELFVSNQVVLPSGGYFSFIISEVRPSDEGDYLVSTVHIEEISERVTIEEVFDYLCEHWFVRDQVSRWLEGRADLPTKEHV
jgi:hypothetical protein